MASRKATGKGGSKGASSKGSGKAGGPRRAAAGRSVGAKGAGSRKSAPKQAARKKAAPKKTAGKKAPPQARRPSPEPREAPTPASTPAPAPAAPKPRPSGAVCSTSVNLGHVFALRPRASTSFRQEDFRAARHLLQDEAYASIGEAARAVAEKALELTHEAGSRRGAPGREG